jgi:hypothetical protein
MTNWTEEDKECVRLLLLDGLTAEQVSNETGIPKGTVNGWKGKWGIRQKNSYKHLYEGTVADVQARLIKIMQEAPEVSYSYFNSADSDTPPATTYRKYFGSWTAAVEAANISKLNKEYTADKYSQKKNLPTKVYLVEFDGYYKLGITQQTVEQRLGGRYPKYTVLQVKELPSLKDAKVLERTLLDLVKDYKYIPKDFPAEGRGFTECFKASPEKLSLISSLLL